MPSASVHIVCESCSQGFTFEIGLLPVSMTKTSYFNYGDRKQVSGASYQYATPPEQFALQQVRRCPHCGYIQSWMQKTYIKQRRAIGMVVSFMLPLVLVLVSTALMSQANSMWGPDTPLEQFLRTLGMILLWSAVIIFSFILFFATGLFDFLLAPNKRHPKTSAKALPQIHVH